MLFSNPIRTEALHAWRAMPAQDERAKADNIFFEQRVSSARLQHFENLAPNTPSPTSLAAWQISYCKTHVETDTPDTFRADLEPAHLGLLDTDQRIVRLVSVGAATLNEAGLTFAELLRSSEDRDHAVLDVFMQRWNAKRDARPAFAAWKDELIGELHFPDWADRMRDRLGLGAIRSCGE